MIIKTINYVIDLDNLSHCHIITRTASIWDEEEDVHYLYAYMVSGSAVILHSCENRELLENMAIRIMRWKKGACDVVDLEAIIKFAERYPIQKALI